MSKLAELKSKWLKDAKVKKAYDEQSLEFSIAQKLISERLKAHLTQKEVAERMEPHNRLLHDLKVALNYLL